MDSPNNVLVVEPRQQLDLPHDFLGQLFVVGVESNPLDGVDLRVQVVLDLHDLTEAAFADLTDVRKLALYDKVNFITRVHELLP